MCQIRNGSGVMNFLKYSKWNIWDMLLNEQLDIRRSTLKQIVRSVLRLLGYIFWLVWTENL